MKKQTIISLVALSVIVAGIASFIPAPFDGNVTTVHSSVVAWTEEELIKNSPVIVKGEILDSKAVLEDKDGMPVVFTIWNVLVTESLKGDIKQNSIIQVKSVGGQVGDHMTVSDNYSDHHKSEVLILFLDKETDKNSYYGTDTYQLVTANYGAYELSNGMAMNDDPTKTTLEQSLKDKIISLR